MHHDIPDLMLSINGRKLRHRATDVIRLLMVCLCLVVIVRAFQHGASLVGTAAGPKLHVVLAVHQGAGSNARIFDPTRPYLK